MRTMFLLLMVGFSLLAEARQPLLPQPLRQRCAGGNTLACGQYGYSSSMAATNASPRVNQWRFNYTQRRCNSGDAAACNTVAHVNSASPQDWANLSAAQGRCRANPGGQDCINLGNLSNSTH